jgi:hypothetical protein
VYDLEHENLRRPEPPGPPRKSSGSFLPIVLVLVPLGILILGILAFTGKAGLLMFAVIASVPAFMILHYFLWGYWLGKNLRETERQGEDDDPDPD